jgi:hypothetical protein
MADKDVFLMKTIRIDNYIHHVRERIQALFASINKLNTAPVLIRK